MKKTYILPEATVFELDLKQQILAGSIVDAGGDAIDISAGGNFDPGSGDIFGHDNDFDFSEAFKDDFSE